MIRRLDEVRLDELAEVRVPGYRVELVNRGARDLAASITADAPGDRALVTISACLGCVTMDIAAWRRREPELAALWAPRAGSGDRLAIEAVILVGERAIAVDSVRSDSDLVHQLHQIHWNDGTTQLVVVCDGARAIDDALPCVATAERAAAAYIGALVGSPVDARN